MESHKRNLTILVTGATGRQGGAVARQLLSAGYSVRALTRKPGSEKASELKKLGAQIIAGDLDNDDTLRSAVTGAWGVFAVFTMAEAGVKWEEEQGKKLAEYAKAAGVYQYVYSSVASADKNTGIPHFESKRRIEERVTGLGLPSYTILRPVAFMENYLNPNTLSQLEKGVLMSGLDANRKNQLVAVSDIGRFGLLAFDKHAELNGSEIELAGDEKTMPEIAEILGGTIGHTVKYAQMQAAELQKINPDFAKMMEWQNKTGYSADIQGLISKYGIRMLSFSQWAAAVEWEKHAPARQSDKY